MSTKSWGQRSIYFSMNKFHIPHSCNVLNLESPNQQKLWSNSCAPLRYLILCSVMTCAVEMLCCGIYISLLWQSCCYFHIFKSLNVFELFFEIRKFQLYVTAIPFANSIHVKNRLAFDAFILPICSNWANLPCLLCLQGEFNLIARHANYVPNANHSIFSKKSPYTWVAFANFNRLIKFTLHAQFRCVRGKIMGERHESL